MREAHYDTKNLCLVISQEVFFFCGRGYFGGGFLQMFAEYWHGSHHYSTTEELCLNTWKLSSPSHRGVVHRKENAFSRTVFMTKK